MVTMTVVVVVVARGGCGSDSGGDCGDGDSVVKTVVTVASDGNSAVCHG
jgi:hypothetical protein